MAITKNGKGWEVINSIYILMSFIIFFHGIGLIVVGLFTRVKKWRRAGLYYTIVAWTLGIVSTYCTGNLSDIIIMLLIVSYIVCIIHNFAIRKEYLIRLELLQNQRSVQHKTEQLKSQVAKEYGIDNDPANGNIYYSKQDPMNNYKKKQASVYDIMNKNQTSQVLIDINTCTQEDLLLLPGVGIIDAKKVLNYRNDNKINSVEEFIDILNLKPHYANTIRPMLIYNKVKINEDNDINIKTENNQSNYMGRMVDF